MNSVPLTGSPPIPTAVVCPRPVFGGLEHCFISKCTGARDNADRPLLEDRSGHDADLALLRRQDSWAVRTDKTRFRAVEPGLDPYHIENRDTLGDADDEGNFRVDRLLDRGRGAGGRYI